MCQSLPGCVESFPATDLTTASAGLEVFALDVLILHWEHVLTGSPHLDTCEQFPLPYASFDGVLSINTLHICLRDGVIRALRNPVPLDGLVPVDSYHTEERQRRVRAERWQGCLG